MTAPREILVESYWFRQIFNGYNVVIMRDDTDIGAGDWVKLRESKTTGYTGEYLKVLVKYVLRHDDFPEAIQPGYCIVGLRA